MRRTQETLQNVNQKLKRIELYNVNHSIACGYKAGVIKDVCLISFSFLDCP
jgi:hypothetical protein